MSGHLRCHMSLGQYFRGDWHKGKPIQFRLPRTGAKGGSGGGEADAGPVDRKVPTMANLDSGTFDSPGNPPRVNRRKLLAVVYHFLQAEEWVAAKALLCSLDNAEAKLHAQMGERLLEEIDYFKEHAPEEFASSSEMTDWHTCLKQVCTLHRGRGTNMST